MNIFISSTTEEKFTSSANPTALPVIKELPVEENVVWSGATLGIFVSVLKFLLSSKENLIGSSVKDADG